MIVGDAIVIVVLILHCCFVVVIVVLSFFLSFFCFRLCCCFYCCFSCCLLKSDIDGGWYTYLINSFDFQAKAAEGIDSCKERTKCGGVKDPAEAKKQLAVLTPLKAALDNPAMSNALKATGLDKGLALCL